jgi:hypothetical protein
MSIEVRCPNGHVLKIKDKYAGKTGLCPLCKDRVVISVPERLTENDILQLIGAPAARESAISESASVFDDSPSAPNAHNPLDDVHESQSIWDEAPEVTSSMSLVGTSAIRHRQKCANCAEDVPYWYAKCPRCGTYFPGTAR